MHLNDDIYNVHTFEYFSTWVVLYYLESQNDKKQFHL